MTEFSFVLKYRLSPEDCVADEIVERLGEAGCTDAFVGIGVAGRLALDFTREAESAQKAVTSALRDTRRRCPRRPSSRHRRTSSA